MDYLLAKGIVQTEEVEAMKSEPSVNIAIHPNAAPKAGLCVGGCLLRSLPQDGHFSISPYIYISPECFHFLCWSGTTHY